MKKTAPAVAPAFYCGQPSQCSGKFDDTKNISCLQLCIKMIIFSTLLWRLSIVYARQQKLHFLHQVFYPSERMFV